MAPKKEEELISREEIKELREKYFVRFGISQIKSDMVHVKQKTKPISCLMFMTIQELKQLYRQN